MIIDLVGGTGGSAFTINKNHIFADNTARDSYFTLNPTEKEDGVLISVGSGYQEYNGANWIEKSPILKGNMGDKGDKGDTGEQGLQGIQGIQGIQGTSGQDASEIVSANFIGNDMVFSKDDTTTFSIINAKVYLTPNIDNKQDLLVSGNNIKTINGNSILGSGNIEIIGGGAGAVDSVNGQVGVVVLDADDISDTSTTNKFITQSDINKLSGIENGAEVNNISDTNAIALTNNGDTSIHYHSSDRIRANHTGTQPASTISDFNTAVAGTPSVTANTAKVSFPEAPNDGSYYARKSLGWSPVLYTENTIFLENPTAPNVASGDSSTKVANTAFVTSQDLGVGQTWKDVTDSRVFGMTYTNATGKPIMVILNTTSGPNSLIANISGTSINMSDTSSGTTAQNTIIIPIGATYSFTGDTLLKWYELR